MTTDRMPHTPQEHAIVGWPGLFRRETEMRVWARLTDVTHPWEKHWSASVSGAPSCWCLGIPYAVTLDGASCA